MRVIDLLHELPRAEKRPGAGVFELREHTLSGAAHATLVAPAPSRIVWILRLPARAVLRTDVAVLPAPGGDVAVTFRVGVSDDRRYDQLAQAQVPASRTRESGWVPITADLSLYGGRQWSLFYRPDSQAWRVVFSADLSRGAGRVLWGAPGIDTDVKAARAWLAKSAAH